MSATIIRVDRRPDESDEKFIRRFLKKVRKEGIIKEVLDRRYHKTKSQKRRNKHEKAIRRELKNKRLEAEAPQE
jgi:ribosomal protein S21